MEAILDLIKNQYYIILVVIVLITIIILVIINLKFNHSVNKIEKEYSDIHFSKDAIVKIDRSGLSAKMAIYSHYKGINKIVYMYNDYLNTIVARDRDKFKDFINQIFENGDSDSIIVRHDSGAITLKNNDFRREYKFIRGSLDNSLIFLKMNEFEIDNSDTESNILDYNQFCYMVKSVTKDELFIQGGILIVQVQSYQKVLNRYNNSTAASYIQQLTNRLKKICTSQAIILAKITENKFLIYNPNLLTRRLAIDFIQEIEVNLMMAVKISSFKINTELNFGFAFFGEFSSLIKKVIVKAEKALEEAIMLPNIINVIIYDTAMEEEYIKISKALESTKKIIDTNLFTPNYSPIIDISTSKTIGYRMSIVPDNHFLTFEDIRKYARELNMVNELNKSVAKTILSHYYFKRNFNKLSLFIELNFNDIATYFQEYQSNLDYNEINVVFIINDYHKFYQDKFTDNNLIENLKMSNIRLFLKAKHVMLTSNHQLFNLISGIVFDKQYIGRIEESEVVKLEMQKINDRFKSFNFNYYVYDIDKYTKLEVVRSMGIQYLEGIWFGVPKVSPGEPETKSLRRINKQN